MPCAYDSFLHDVHTCHNCSIAIEPLRVTILKVFTDILMLPVTKLLRLFHHINFRNQIRVTCFIFRIQDGAIFNNCSTWNNSLLVIRFTFLESTILNSEIYQIHISLEHLLYYISYIRTHIVS